MKKSKYFDLIIFDWDGTLMDSTAHIVSAIQEACRELGLPVPSKEEASHVIGLSLSDAMKTVCPVLSDRDIQRLVGLYQKYYLQRRQEAVLFDGVQEGLEQLRQSGYFLAVATGKGRQGLDYALEQTQTGSCFDVTRTVSECASKPDPEMIFSICDFLALEPKKALMIGDTTYDLLMAQAAGSYGVAMTTGAHPVDLLQSAPSLAMCRDFDQLLNWLENYEFVQ